MPESVPSGTLAALPVPVSSDDSRQTGQSYEALLKHLRDAEDLVKSLKSDNDALRASRDEQRAKNDELLQKVASNSRAEYRTSRLMRIFDALDVEPPSSDGDDDLENFVSDDYLKELKDKIRERQRSISPFPQHSQLPTLTNALSQSETLPAYDPFNVPPLSDTPTAHEENCKMACECLHILAGASEIDFSLEPPRVKLCISNSENTRSMAFWLSWSDDKVDYTRIHTRLEEHQIPEFAKLESIEFSRRQGPNFLSEILEAVHVGTIVRDPSELMEVT